MPAKFAARWLFYRTVLCTGSSFNLQGLHIVRSCFRHLADVWKTDVLRCSSFVFVIRKSKTDCRRYITWFCVFNERRKTNNEQRRLLAAVF